MEVGSLVGAETEGDRRGAQPHPSNNRPESTARAVRDSPGRLGVWTLYIEPELP